MNQVASTPAPRGLDSPNDKPSSIAQPVPTPPILRPSQPPGRRSRKVRAYADQIRQLRALGYSIELIREALAEVGVDVSWSTVQREAARPCHAMGSAAPDHQNASAPPVARAWPPIDCPSDATQLSAEVRGKDFAEAFMSSRVNNPLLRKDKR